MKSIVYEENPESICWYCEKRGEVEKHHLFRGWQRSQSPIVWLCWRCHRKATINKWFEKYLQKLWQGKK